jgi:hypothetical protein
MINLPTKVSGEPGPADQALTNRTQEVAGSNPASSMA